MLVYAVTALVCIKALVHTAHAANRNPQYLYWPYRLFFHFFAGMAVLCVLIPVWLVMF
jgi:hypothetical protein